MKLHTDTHAAHAAQLFVQAEAHLQVLIRDALGRGAKGTARYYKNQLGEVQRVLDSLTVNGLPAVAESVGQGYVTGALVAERALGINGNFSGVHKDAVSVLIDNAVHPLGDAITSVGRQTEDLFRKAALGDVTLGIIEGSTRKQVTQAFIGNLVKQGVTGFVDKSGRRWGIGSYAKMVARTTTREAVSHGTANRLLENGHDLVTISSHAHQMDECSDFEGNTYSLSGDTPGYDVLSDYPPFHPNCVHVLTPAEATFAKYEQSVAADAVTPKPEVVSDPFKAAAARIQQTMAFQPSASRQSFIESFAPNGLDDPALDLPWASNGETRRQRIQNLIAEDRAKDVGYLTRVGEHIEREAQALIGSARADLEKLHSDLEAKVTKLDDAQFAKQTEALAAPNGSPERKALDAEHDVLWAATQEARHEWYKVKATLVDVDVHVRTRLLAEVRPGYGTGNLKVARKSDVSEMIKDQAQYLPREWVDQSSQFSAVRTKAVTGRAYYSSGDELIQVRRGDRSTALHELGHRMEHMRKSIRDAEAAFYKHRTGDEPLRRLADIHPGQGLRHEEVTREDKFTSAYMGKEYGGQFYELLTMGLEGVFHGRHGLIGAVRPAHIVDELAKYWRALADTKPGSPREEHFLSRIKRLEAQHPANTDDEYVHWMLGVLATV